MRISYDHTPDAALASVAVLSGPPPAAADPTTPDLSFLAYLSDSRFGAMVYNAAHSYMAPMTLMTLGFGFASPLTLSIALIWLAHIGFDRALGYGLKYSAGFNFTHLGRIGRQKDA